MWRRCALVREENIIGDDVRIGTNTVFERSNGMVNGVRVHRGRFPMVVPFGDEVLVGPSVVLADDLHSPCPRYKQCKGGAVVGARVNRRKSEYPVYNDNQAGALVGAGSVVVGMSRKSLSPTARATRVLSRRRHVKCEAFFVMPDE